MAQLLYYLVIRPTSMLPLPVLYYLSDFMFIIFYYLVGFRKSVVTTNLRNSFPEKSPKEIRAIQKEFYRHFCDLIVESIRMFSMSEEEAVRRCRAVNTEVLQKLYDEGRSIFIIAGHYNNWELAALALQPQISHLTVGIYTPLSNTFFEEKMRESRGKFGMVLLPRGEVKKFFRENTHRLTATLMGGDQSPTYNKKVYWTRFLNQETAVAFGTEKYAREYDYPVVFGWMTKVRRGYYEMRFELLEEHPATSPHGSITERHTRLLEQQIMETPPYWLWTHKRWKRKKPADVHDPVRGSDH